MQPAVSSSPELMPHAEPDAHSAEGPCRNCEAPMHGPYCAQCGQHAVHADVTLHDLVHDATHEFLHLDGKIVETLKLLVTQPGRLTAEHWRGRRARYVAPIRLYLTLSVLYFLVAAVTDPVEKAVAENRTTFRMTDTPKAVAAAERVSQDSVASTMEAEGARRGGTAGFFFRQAARVQRDRIGFARRMREAIPKIFFVFMPVFAWVVSRVYRRRANYPAHLYFAIHTFSFGFLSAAVAEIVGLVPGASFVAGWALMGAWGWYGVRALREVYGGSLRGTIARAAAISAIGVLAFGLVGVVGAVLVFSTF